MGRLDSGERVGASSYVKPAFCLLVLQHGFAQAKTKDLRMHAVRRLLAGMAVKPQGVILPWLALLF